MKTTINKLFLLSVILTITFNACKDKKADSTEVYNEEIVESSEEIDAIEMNKDTLNVGYTYWWSQAGPFIGSCAQPYSLAFIGTVSDIKEPMTKHEEQSYTSQWGTIKVDEVLAKKTLENMHYHEEAYVTFDCFYESEIDTGDRVLVFLYEYEGGYVIPGSDSMIKISEENDPKVASIKTYIAANYDPLSIEKDMDLWQNVGHAEALFQLIECKKTTL